MTAPSLRGAPAEQQVAGFQRSTRLSAAATVISGHAVLAALAAAEATTEATAETTAEQPPMELDQFIDELASIVHCPITTYQRELLQAALIGTIDARFATLLARQFA
ncbi:MAG: hypothetical protein ACJ74U_05500 [Jatrophihabitantaceae bacterium]